MVRAASSSHSIGFRSGSGSVEVGLLLAAGCGSRVSHNLSKHEAPGERQWGVFPMSILPGTLLVFFLVPVSGYSP